MPFYVVQFQVTGDRALVPHREQLDRFDWATFDEAQARASEASGWDGRCGVIHAGDDEQLQRILAIKDQ